MKHLTLRDVMASMSITNNSDGYEVSNAAGSAQYDAWGLRTTVNGIPEYFPLKISAPGVLAGNADSESSSDHRRHSLWHSTNNVQTHDKGKVISKVTVQIDVDISDAQQKLEELNASIRGSDVFNVFSGAMFLFPATMPRLLANKRQLRKAVRELVNEAIKTECRPGGLLYKRSSR
ncbi:hypothetical protein MUN35_04815 [Hafnia paralvei]|uniref:hypothetical protein n=1 Tax=Hafnia paralvei TaxID=546367 RepID=UPI001FFEBAEA|nr:hypothetical protein [Hafnia paralvei]MCK2179028.1 hypothetical protein [Hafnia paralvei]